MKQWKLALCRWVSTEARYIFKSIHRNTPERSRAVAVGTAAGVMALVALAGFFAWWRLRRKRLAQNTLPVISPEVNIVPFDPPPSCVQEKVGFPSDSQPVSSSTTSVTPLPLTRNPTIASSSSPSRPLPPPVAPPDGLPSDTGLFQVAQSSVLQPNSGNHDTQLLQSPATGPLPVPRSAHGNMDVPPPAYTIWQ